VHCQVADRLQAIATVPSLQRLSFDPEPLLRVALHLREAAGPRAGGGFSSLAKTLNLLGNALKANPAVTPVSVLIVPIHVYVGIYSTVTLSNMNR
jgi:hypothetical protein